MGWAGSCPFPVGQKRSPRTWAAPGQAPMIRTPADHRRQGTCAGVHALHRHRPDRLGAGGIRSRRTWRIAQTPCGTSFLHTFLSGCQGAAHPATSRSSATGPCTKTAGGSRRGSRASVGRPANHAAVRARGMAADDDPATTPTQANLASTRRSGSCKSCWARPGNTRCSAVAGMSFYLLTTASQTTTYYGDITERRVRHVPRIYGRSYADRQSSRPRRRRHDRSQADHLSFSLFVEGGKLPAPTR
jgi:hypothetical protein